MATAEDILIRIAISGQGDVVSSLGTIGSAGEEAFAKLERAVLDSSAVLAGIVTAIAGVGVALETWAKHSTDAVVNMNNLATASGSTIEQMSGLQGALAGMGANTDNLGFAFRRLSLTMENSWNEIKKSAKAASDVLVNDNLAIQESALSVAGAQSSLEQAQLNLQKLQAQRGNAPAVDAEVEAELKLRDAYRAVDEAQLKLQQSQQKALEAQKKAVEDQRNSVQAVGDAVKSIIAGTSNLVDAKQTANLDDLNNVVKGIVLSAKSSEEELKGFHGSLTDVANSAPSVQQAFLNIADFMKNSGDAAVNSALAIRLFGRSVGQDMIQALSKGSEALKANIADAQKFGLVFTDVDKKVSVDFHEAFNTMSSDLSVIITQIGEKFAPAFTTGFRQIIDAVTTGHEGIMKWAEDVANKVNPVIRDFFNMLAGGTKEFEVTGMKNLFETFKSIGEVIKNTVIPAVTGLFNYFTGGESEPGSKAKEWQDSFKAFGDAVKPIFTTVIEVIKAIYNAIDSVVKLVNNALGTSFTAGQVIAVAAIAKITGALGLVEAALGRIGTAAKALGALAILGPSGFATAAASGAAGGKIGETVVEGAAAGATAGLVEMAVKAGIGAVGGLVGIAAAVGTVIGVLAIEKGKELAKEQVGTGATDRMNQESLRRIHGVMEAGAKETTDAIGESWEPEADARKRSTDAINKEIEARTKATVTVMRPEIAPKTGREEVTVPGTLGPGEVGPPAPTKVQILRPSLLGQAPATVSVPVEGGFPGETTGVNVMRPAIGIPPPGQTQVSVPSGEFGQGAQPFQGFEMAGEAASTTSENVTSLGTASTEAARQITTAGQSFENLHAENLTQSLERNISEGAQSLGSTITQGAGVVRAALDLLAQSLHFQPGQPLGGEGHAAGGVVHGPGTGTSDSVPIMASRGEFVVTATGSNLGDAIKYFGGGFSLGGIVDALSAPILRGIPHMASGGLVPVPAAPTGRPLVLDFGEKRVGGMTVTENSANELQRIAMDRSMRSGGRKQTWYR